MSTNFVRPEYVALSGTAFDRIKDCHYRPVLMRACGKTRRNRGHRQSSGGPDLGLASGAGAKRGAWSRVTSVFFRDDGRAIPANDELQRLMRPFLPSWRRSNDIYSE